MKKPEDISSTDVAEALADPVQRAELTAFLATHNVSLPPEELPSDVLKAALADIGNRKTQPQAQTGADEATLALSSSAITDDMVARALQNAEMRKALEGLLKANGYDGPLEQAPSAMIKTAIVTIFQYAQSQQSEPRQPGTGTGTLKPDQISDEMLDAALANERMREALSNALKTLGVEKPLDEAPRDLVRAAFAAMAAVAEQRQQAHKPQIPDEVVAQIFADPRVDGLLRDFMQQNGLEGEPQDLPDHGKRQIVEVLIQQGAISFGENKET